MHHDTRFKTYFLHFIFISILLLFRLLYNRRTGGMVFQQSLFQFESIATIMTQEFRCLDALVSGQVASLFVLSAAVITLSAYIYRKSGKGYTNLFCSVQFGFWFSYQICLSIYKYGYRLQQFCCECSGRLANKTFSYNTLLAHASKATGPGIKAWCKNRPRCWHHFFQSKSLFHIE